LTRLRLVERLPGTQVLAEKDNLVQRIHASTLPQNRDAALVRAMEGWQTQLVAAPNAHVETDVAATILLPAYNEQAAIRDVLQEIVDVLSGTSWSYEILVVDDASTDDTADIAEQFAAQCWECPVRVVRSAENRGAGAARKIGVRSAHGQIIVMLDADGSYPAAAIPELLRHFPAYDQVNGARTSEQGAHRWLRVPAKWAIRKLACYLTGHQIPDLNTGLKAFRRDAMLPWLWVVPNGFSCVTTMTLAFLTNGYAVKYVPVEYRPRVGQSKFHPIHDTLAYLSTVLRMVLYFRPLKVFLPLATAVIGAGFTKCVYSRLTTGSMQESDIVVLVAGFMTCMLGLLAEVIVAHHRR
jgi:polyisoprenyl-phosphate glycosyltransferase